MHDLLVAKSGFEPGLVSLPEVCASHTHTHTEEDKVTREAETGVMRPQAKEFWQLEAGGDMEWILL